MRIRTALAGALAAVVAVALGACGSDEDTEAPTACSGPIETYLSAVEAAPGEVRLDGPTAISDCLTDEQPTGQLATIGETVIAVATELNQRVRRDFEPKTALRLGYLVGAVEQGAESTGGIHQDLVLRLNAAARYTEQGEMPLGAAFERAFGQGYAAAQRNG